ncbi:hypothetical protein BDZ97DRAFT_1752650 [Flammula alnicola]|nr:hypothetical protein BDZ97DRAFT_1752650 [Flammula alnicola]
MSSHVTFVILIRVVSSYTRDSVRLGYRIIDLVTVRATPMVQRRDRRGRQAPRVRIGSNADVAVKKKFALLDWEGKRRAVDSSDDGRGMTWGCFEVLASFLRVVKCASRWGLKPSQGGAVSAETCAHGRSWELKLVDAKWKTGATREVVIASIKYYPLLILVERTMMIE